MNFNIIADYHTHTNIAKGSIPIFRTFFSKHGKGSLRENAEAAMRRELKEIAITDHGFKHYLFGMTEDLYKVVREQIDELNEEFKTKKRDFRILLGSECNILTRNGDIDISEKMVNYLDLICAGYHRGAIKDPFTNRSIKKNFTECAVNAMSKYDITVLHHPMDHVYPDIMEVGKVAVLRNTALELNRKHGNMTKEQVRKLKQIGVTFSLGSDAHGPEMIGQFGEAYKLALESGLNNDDLINGCGKAHDNMKLLKKKIKNN